MGNPPNSSGETSVAYLMKRTEQNVSVGYLSSNTMSNTRTSRRQSSAQHCGMLRVIILIAAATLQVSDAFSVPLRNPTILTRSSAAGSSCFSSRGTTQSSTRRSARIPPLFVAPRMADAPAADCACTIIGAGRIGTALAEMGKAGGFSDTIVRRGEPIPADGTGPIYVTVRNDDLKAVIDGCPASRRGDLVFYGQNGYIEDFLKQQGLSGPASSQVLVYMAVAKLGEKPTDGITDLNPEGLTSATGKWAAQVAARLKGSSLTCGVYDAAPFRTRMFEKHMWICAFMLLGVEHSCTVGEVESKHTAELTQMVTEMMTAVKDETGSTFGPKCPERLLAYARSVAHFPTALKEFNWRNKYFLDITRAREAKGLPDLTPMHTKLLMKARDDGKVKFD